MEDFLPVNFLIYSLNKHGGGVIQKYTQGEVAGLAMVSSSSIHSHMNASLIQEPCVIVGRRRHYDEGGKDLVVAYFRALHTSRVGKYWDYIEDNQR